MIADFFFCVNLRYLRENLSTENIDYGKAFFSRGIPLMLADFFFCVNLRYLRENLSTGNIDYEKAFFYRGFR